MALLLGVPVPGCDAAREGRHAVGHALRCRKRIEDLMVEEEERRARLELAVGRTKLRNAREAGGELAAQTVAEDTARGLKRKAEGAAEEEE
eukprot:5070020-Amphidinium_carterae.1